MKGKLLSAGQLGSARQNPWNGHFDPIIPVLGILIMNVNLLAKSDYLLNPSTSFHFSLPP